MTAGRFALVLAAAAALLARPGEAATMSAYSTEELVGFADLVVIGSAVTVTPHRDERGAVVRSVAFQVDEYVIGKGPSRITVRLFGGTLGGVATRVSGEIDLAVGERQLLFLRRDPDGDLYRTVGMGQGRFRVVEDGKTRERFVTHMLPKDLRLLNEAKGDPVGLGRNDTSFFMALDRFVAEIRRLAGEKKLPEKR